MERAFEVSEVTKPPCDNDPRRQEIIDVQRQVIAALFVSVLAVVPTLWMLLDRSPPYTFEYVEIIPNDVPQGENVRIEFTALRNRMSCGPGIIYHQFKEASGKLHLYEPVHRDDVVDVDIKNGKFTRVEKLPDGISVGPTFYRDVDCYNCNPMHSLLRWPVCTSTPNVKFNVVEERKHDDGR